MTLKILLVHLGKAGFALVNREELSYWGKKRKNGISVKRPVYTAEKESPPDVGD
jgi:hypothetical protein